MIVVVAGGCGRANARLQIFDLSGKWLATWNCMDEPPYGVRMFGAQESDGSADAAPEAHLLVTGLTPRAEGFFDVATSDLVGMRAGGGSGVGGTPAVSRHETISLPSGLHSSQDASDIVV